MHVLQARRGDPVLRVALIDFYQIQTPFNDPNIGTMFRAKDGLFKHRNYAIPADMISRKVVVGTEIAHRRHPDRSPEWLYFILYGNLSGMI